MAIVKVYRNGQSQADDLWGAFEDALELFTEDFFDDRVQPPLDVRESL